MKNYVYLLQFLIFVSCTQPVSDNGNQIYTEDPEVGGLVPYHQVSINVNDDFMPEYDSIKFFYDIVIDRPSWSDAHHDSIRIKRHKHHNADSNFWDRAELYGIKHGMDEWTTICQLNIFDDNTDREYYSLLTGLINVISPDLEETMYFIDDEDWQRNGYFYQNYMGKDWRICGTIKVR